MRSNTSNYDITYYKACLKEVGEIARQNGDKLTFQATVAAWKQADKDEKSMIAPWD